METPRHGCNTSTRVLSSNNAQLSRADLVRVSSFAERHQADRDVKIPSHRALKSSTRRAKA
jgi:hypothetical protein